MTQKKKKLDKKKQFNCTKEFTLNKIKKCIERFFKKLSDYNIFGAGEGIRTLDFNLGKVALYP